MVRPTQRAGSSAENGLPTAPRRHRTRCTALSTCSVEMLLPVSDLEAVIVGSGAVVAMRRVHLHLAHFTQRCSFVRSSGNAILVSSLPHDQRNIYPISNGSAILPMPYHSGACQCLPRGRGANRTLIDRVTREGTTVTLVEGKSSPNQYAPKLPS